MRKSSFLFIFVLLLIWGSCDNPVRERQRRIENYVQARIESHREYKIKSCLNKIVNTAQKAVENYIRQNEDKILSRQKTIFLPPRPESPEIKKISDSLKIQPILAGDTM